MLINSPRELFVVLLSDLRQGADRTIKIIYEISQMVQDPDIREALEARVFISYNILSTLRTVLQSDRCRAGEGEWSFV